MGRALVFVVAIGGTGFVIAVSAVGWGGFGPLLENTARAAFVVLMVLFTVVALFSPVNMSHGRREDVRGRRSMLLAALGVAVLAWMMPALDRRDVATLDGDAVRTVGVVLTAVGGILRIWPMFVLGRRFSGYVAIQADHELVTTGLYRRIRHPSYLGMMLGLAGWALVFRSAVGLLGVIAGLPLLIQRIDVEESLLASNFGAAYEDYRRRSWRLLPYLF